MKAYVLYGINDLRYVDVKMPHCPKGWATVKVKAAGICSSDIARIFTKGTYHFPTIPGHEFSGIVEDVGDKKDARLIGKHVGVFPLIPCKECPQCLEKHYEMCVHYDYIGSRRDGGFAEKVIVPIWNLVPIDDSIPFTSAAMLEPLSVALHAIRLSRIQEGNSVGIIGTGMIGISAAQWAKMLKAGSITILGRSEAKRKLIENCSLTYDVYNDSYIGSFDIVLEAVGNPSAIEEAIYAVKPGGTIVLMGNPSGDILFRQDTYWRILRKQLRITGTWNSSFDGINSSDWTTAVNALSLHKINVETLITHILPQDQLITGLQIMQEHKEQYCKIMTVWNE